VSLNCRWVTDKVQCRNRTSSRIIDFNGQQKTLVEWAEINSMSINCLFERLKRGWSIEKALTTKIQIKIKNQ
jgi:ribosome-associated toxin RatA of RatAB toxin-antitoxin module